MTYVKRFKTMYMHTIDGEPATFDEQFQYLHFVGGRNKAMLVKSRRQIQRDQMADIRSAILVGKTVEERKRALARYSYVLVEVPLDAR